MRIRGPEPTTARHTRSPCTTGRSRSSRSEIGLRRALGATRGQIRAQFLAEAILLSLAGGAQATATRSVRPATVTLSRAAAAPASTQPGHDGK